MKGNLLQGTARGRMGEIVASVRHGKQLFSKYQPNVVNPKSAKQMSQRDRFARASKFAKLFTSDGIYANTYATLKNSSRSLYLNIVQREILYELMNSGANLPLSRILPLMSNNINGNVFNNPLVNDQATSVGTLLINGAKPTGDLYFGSYTKFKGNKAIIKVITPISTDPDYSASLKVIKSNLTEASTDDIVTSSPANYGFQNSVADCGNWPFIYSFKLDAENGGFGIPFNTNSMIADAKPIADVLVFSNENETIAYLHDREIEYLEDDTPVTP